MTARKNPFAVGNRVKAKLGRYVVLRQGDDEIADLRRYTITAVHGSTVCLDDYLKTDPATRWPAEHFVRDEVVES